MWQLIWVLAICLGVRTMHFLHSESETLEGYMAIALVSKDFSWKMLSTNFSHNSCQILSFSFSCAIVPKIPSQGKPNQCLSLLLRSQLQTQTWFCKSSPWEPMNLLGFLREHRWGRITYGSGGTLPPPPQQVATETPYPAGMSPSPHQHRWSPTSPVSSGLYRLWPSPRLLKLPSVEQLDTQVRISWPTLPSLLGFKQSTRMTWMISCKAEGYRWISQDGGCLVWRTVTQDSHLLVVIALVFRGKKKKNIIYTACFPYEFTS